MARYLDGIVAMLVSDKRGEAGNALVEYALVLAFFALATMAGLTLLGTTTSNVLSSFQGNYNSYNVRHA